MTNIFFGKLKSFLFDHQTTRQTIFKNTFWLGLTELVSRSATFVLFIFIARILGATEYGKFSFALALVSLLMILPGFVSSDIITREFSQKKEREKEFSNIISLKLFLGLASILFLFGVSFFVSSDAAIQKAIWILSAYWILSSLLETFYAFFRARQRMEYESYFKISDAVLTTAFGLFVILKFPSIENLSYAYLAEVTAVFCAIIIFFYLKILGLSFSFDRAVWKKMLSLSWPLALIGIITSVYNQIDTVIMGSFNQITQTGWYNAAFKTARLTLIPAALISQSFYPVLSRFFQESKERFREVWSYQIRVMIFLAVPLAAGGVVLAPKIIEFFFGRDYIQAVLSFQILIVMTGVIFLYDIFRQVLVVVNQQKKLFWIALSGAVINVALNLILIPRFSLNGAAAATLVANIFIMFMFFYLAPKYASVKPFNLETLLNLAQALIAAGIMYLLISRSVIYNLPLVLAVLCGIASYFLVLLFLIFIKKYAKF